MTLSPITAWVAAVVIVGVLLVIGAWEPARGPQMSTFQEERLPR